MTEIPDGYVVGLGRDVPHPKLSHLYKGTFDDPGWPMCRYGWNRDEGTSYSIWRGNFGDGGVCRICQRRAKEGREPVPPRDYIPAIDAGHQLADPQSLRATGEEP